MTGYVISPIQMTRVRDLHAQIKKERSYLSDWELSIHDIAKLDRIINSIDKLASTVHKGKR